MNTSPALQPCVRTAVFSACGRYRYMLGRRWSDDGDQLIWIMLNPSRADDTIDDPTIRRCMSFSRVWGYGGMVVVNLYALCSTVPDELETAADPIGAENNLHITKACAIRSTAARCPIIAAWGAHPAIKARARQILSIAGPDIDCLGMTRTGHPRHPLYVPATQPRTRYPIPVAC